MRKVPRSFVRAYHRIASFPRLPSYRLPSLAIGCLFSRACHHVEVLALSLINTFHVGVVIKYFSTLQREIWKRINHRVHFGFVFEENSVRKLTWLSRVPDPSFSKTPFSDCSVASTRKQKDGVYKLLLFEERFIKSTVFVSDKCGQ